MLLPEPWIDLYTMLPAFLLVLFRIAGLMLASPLFSSPVIPMQFKVLLALAISMTVYPVVATHLPGQVTIVSALMGLAGEVLIGLFIGMGIAMVLLGVQLAAETIGYQAGLGLGNVFNPMMDTNSTVLAQFYFFIATMIFLGIGGDRALIVALLNSFESVPPLAIQVTDGVMALVIDMLDVAFELAIRIGGPAVLSLMLGFIVLGFVSRTMPQLNILTVGFPMKLMLALGIMALTIMSIETALLDGFRVCMDAVRTGLGLTMVNS